MDKKGLPFGRPLLFRDEIPKFDPENFSGNYPDNVIPNFLRFLDGFLVLAEMKVSRLFRPRVPCHPTFEIRYRLGGVLNIILRQR